MKVLFGLFLVVSFMSCSKDKIKYGDEIFITVDLNNKNGQRVDDNYLPNGEISPLRIVVGKGYVYPEIDNSLIGKIRGDEYVIKLKSSTFPNGIYYLDKKKRIYVVNVKEILTAKIKILNYN